MQQFWFNIQYGINHVLDPNAYDHLLFLIVLTAPFLFKNWKRVFLLVTLFTIGHTFSLLLGAYGIIKIATDIIEFLIPLSILIVALFNVFISGRNTTKKKVDYLFISTFFFGLIHGLGFAREFKLLVGNDKNKLITLFEFALGIEIAQIIIVFSILFLGYMLQTIFRVSKRDWILVVSSIVVGLVIPMLLNSPLF